MIHSFGAKTLNDAVELVSMLGESTNQNPPLPAPANQIVPYASANKNAPLSSTSDQNAPLSVSSNKNAALSSGSTNQVKSTNTAQKQKKKKELFMKPLLLCQGITDALKQLVLREVDTASSDQADLLMLVVHALVTETSLLLKVFVLYYINIVKSSRRNLF